MECVNRGGIPYDALAVNWNSAKKCVLCACVCVSKREREKKKREREITECSQVHYKSPIFAIIIKGKKNLFQFLKKCVVIHLN